MTTHWSAHWTKEWMPLVKLCCERYTCARQCAGPPDLGGHCAHQVTHLQHKKAPDDKRSMCLFCFVRQFLCPLPCSKMPVTMKLLAILPVLVNLPSSLIPWLFMKAEVKESTKGLIRNHSLRLSRPAVQRVQTLIHLLGQHVQYATAMMPKGQNCLAFAVHVLTVALSTGISRSGFVQEGGPVCVVNVDHPMVHYTDHPHEPGMAPPSLWERRLDAASLQPEGPPRASNLNLSSLMASFGNRTAGAPSWAPDPLFPLDPGKSSLLYATRQPSGHAWWFAQTPSASFSWELAGLVANSSHERLAVVDEQEQLIASSIAEGSSSSSRRAQGVRSPEFSDPLLFMAYHTAGVSGGTFRMSSTAHAEATAPRPSGTALHSDSYAEGTYHVKTYPIACPNCPNWTLVHIVHENLVVPRLAASVDRNIAFTGCYLLVIFLFACAFAGRLTAQLRSLGGRMNALKQLEFQGLLTLAETTSPSTLASVPSEGRLSPLQSPSVHELLPPSVSSTQTLVSLHVSCSRHPSEGVGESDVVLPNYPRVKAVVKKNHLLEFNLMEKSFAGLVHGLYHFAGFVPQAVVRSIVNDGSQKVLGMQWKQLTIMFTDVVGFTTISETMRPDMLVRLLQMYLEDLTSKVVEYKGTVDKYIGDGLMAFWNSPEPVEGHEQLAVECAIRIKDAIRDQRLWSTRIGIHTDRALVGTMGCQARLSYTALGDSVNVASRLEAACNYFSCPILASKHTMDFVHGVTKRYLGFIRLKGRQSNTEVFAVEAMESDATSELREGCATFNAAMAHYLSREFYCARKMFLQYCRSMPYDDFATRMVATCEECIGKPPHGSWTGAHSIAAK